MAEFLRIQKQFLEQTTSIQKQRIGFDVVYVDVGGLSGGSDGLLEALISHAASVYF